MLVRRAGKDSETVLNALVKRVAKPPRELYKSLTWDPGTEMTGHKRFTVATDIQVYATLSIWQRGSNENMNGLLRQYFGRAQTSQPIRKQYSMA